MPTTQGKPSGTLKNKSTSKNLNTLIEISEQSGKDEAIIRAEVRAYIRVALVLDVPVTYTLNFTPKELEKPF